MKLFFSAAIALVATALSATVGAVVPWSRITESLSAFQTASRLDLTLHGQRFKLEIARTEAEHERGLMGRTSIPANAGMLFVFDHDQPIAFWMKDTLVPLDILFIDQNGLLTTVAHDSPPCRMDPCPSFFSNGPVRYVIELPAGTAQRLHLSIGEAIRIRVA